MHFTPPVQVIYAMRQALKEYFTEGEEQKWERHQRVFKCIKNGLYKLGFRTYISDDKEAKLVAATLYPSDLNWDFNKIHDCCYERGFTIYPRKVEKRNVSFVCIRGDN